MADHHIRDLCHFLFPVIRPVQLLQNELFAGSENEHFRKQLNRVKRRAFMVEAVVRRFHDQSGGQRIHGGNQFLIQGVEGFARNEVFVQENRDVFARQTLGTNQRTQNGDPFV